MKLRPFHIALNACAQLMGVLAIWAVFKVFRLPGHFIFIWVLSLGTVHQAVLRVRALMEHGGLKYNERAQLCMRTVRSGVLTKLLAPYSINFHIEHHLFPNVPGFRLPQLGKIISGSGEEGDLIASNYLKAFCRF